MKAEEKCQKPEEQTESKHLGKNKRTPGKA